MLNQDRRQFESVAQAQIAATVRAYRQRVADAKWASFAASPETMADIVSARAAERQHEVEVNRALCAQLRTLSAR